MIFQSVKAQTESGNLKPISVQKIWDAAPRNAFTDLPWHKGQFFGVFREGTNHVSPHGALGELLFCTQGKNLGVHSKS